ncbi:MAG: hypothetical protein ACE5QW_06735 [Thermoplasmata archaeon]
MKRSGSGETADNKRRMSGAGREDVRDLVRELSSVDVMLLAGVPVSGCKGYVNEVSLMYYK